MKCAQPGAKLAELEVKPGYWRASSTSEMQWIKKCFNEEACVGSIAAVPSTGNATADGALTTGSARRLDGHASGNGTQGVVPRTFGNGLCAEGHEGLYCALCAEGYHGYSDTKLCQKCEGNAGGLAAQPIIFGLFLLVCIIIFVRSSDGAILANAMDKEFDAEAMAKESATNAAKSVVPVPKAVQVKVDLFSKLLAKFMPKIKILISLWQVLKGIGFSFSIPYPDVYQDTINFLADLIEIEVPQILPFECVSRLNFFHKVLFRTIVPLVIYATFFAAAKVFKSRGSKAKSDILIDTIFFIIFLVFPSTVSDS